MQKKSEYDNKLIISAKINNLNDYSKQKEIGVQLNNYVMKSLIHLFISFLLPLKLHFFFSSFRLVLVYTSKYKNSQRLSPGYLESSLSLMPTRWQVQDSEYLPETRCQLFYWQHQMRKPDLVQSRKFKMSLFLSPPQFPTHNLKKKEPVKLVTEYRITNKAFRFSLQLQSKNNSPLAYLFSLLKNCKTKIQQRICT